MKNVLLFLALCLWIASTLILTITLIGLLVVMDEDSSWSKIPDKIFEQIK